MNLKILNAKEKKEFLKVLESQWGFSKKMEYAFLMSPKEKVYLIHRDLEKVDTSRLRVDTLGVYFAEFRNGEIRLSIEGSQIIGKDCSKNVVELSREQMRSWLKGKDLEEGIPEGEGYRGFVILKHENDFLGTGKLKEGKITNFVPKTRRIMADD